MIIDRYVIKHFIPIFFVAMGMFVLLIVLIDLFVNLVTYLNYEAQMSQILLASFYFIPKSVSYALPISLVFSVAYTLGDLYARNELTTIITSGVPYWRLCASFMLIGFCASFIAFFFEDNIVVPTFRIKNSMTRTLKHQRTAERNSDIVIKTHQGKRIYSVDYYDYNNRILNGVSIIEKDDEGNFESQIRAPTARWSNDHWEFINPVVYAWNDDMIKVDQAIPPNTYDEDPELFRRSAVDPADLNARDAGALALDLREAGLPYVAALADVYHRYSFSSVSFIVVVLSISMGGRFRKNILLMSLFTSIACAVVFYVVEMVTMLMAKYGVIPPIFGAWFPVFLFIVIGTVLVRYSKT